MLATMLMTMLAMKALNFVMAMGPWGWGYGGPYDSWGRGFGPGFGPGWYDMGPARVESVVTE